MKRLLLMAVVICFGTGRPSISASGMSLFDQGISGYTGRVESFTRPITLRYREVSRFQTSAEMIMLSEVNRSTAEMTFVCHGSIRRSDDKLVWEIVFEQISINKKKMRTEGPLMSISTSVFSNVAVV